MGWWVRTVYGFWIDMNTWILFSLFGGYEVLVFKSYLRRLRLLPQHRTRRHRMLGRP